MLPLIILIFIPFSSISSIKIGRISEAMIMNSNSPIEKHCASCICRCLAVNSSTSCCHVNCFLTNDTCQVILSSSSSELLIIVEQTSTVYQIPCETSSSTATTNEFRTTTRRVSPINNGTIEAATH